MAFDHAFYAISGSDDEYDEYGVYQTDIDTELLSSRKVKTKYYLHTPIASINEIGVAEAINIVTSIAFLIAFAILRIQPVNDIAYFPKWYLKGLRTSSIQTALQMPEPELVRSRFCCLLEDLRTRVQEFFPIACVAFTTMVHVNWKNKGLDGLKHSNISYSDIDKLSLSNIPNGSDMRCQPRCLRLRRKNENPGGRNLVLELLVVRGPLEEGRRAIGRSLSDDEPPEDGAKGVL
ncbi:BnaA07g02900D [Brassica napus]|uniref:BnaA07g02900D protein n=1 Tax=Brassica napus TaxID=3708 RepID=A0A078GCZ2_BRANA|nr:BnaA07g02900D [Brassica napus]